MPGPKAISNYQPQDVASGAIHPASGANFVQGLFVGIQSGNAQLILADHRNSAGRYMAVGCLTHSAQIKDPLGNVVQTVTQMSYIRKGRMGNMVGLKPGQPYYLSSGGNIQLTKPATVGDVSQQVGVAESETILVIDVGPALIN